MSNADPRGKFVWHELLTSDTAGAGAFYPKVVPWKSQPWDRDPSYTLWMGKGGPIGGVATLDETTGAPRWLAYVGVEDVHAAVAEAKSMGAKVLKDVTEMPETGTYAVLADPQGAEFAVYKSQNPSNGSDAPSAGEFSWHELSTSDADAAVKFYSKLCGWGVGPKHDMGAEFGTYHLMLQNGNQYVGIFQSSSTPPGWMCYVKVDDVGKAANAAKSAGGRVINGPMEVPGGSWIAQILDPAGVMFAVHEEKVASAAEPAKAAPKPKAQKTNVVKPGAPAAEATDAKTSDAKSAAAKPDAKPAASKPAAKPAASKPAAPSAPAETKGAAKPAAKTAAAKKAPAKKAAGKKAAARKAPAKSKAAGKKAAKKAPGKAAKKSGRRTVAKKAAGKKAAKRKAAPAKKSSARKAKKRR
jgi:predicted enzyme related to lactoylglutathione lyase